MLAFSSVFYYNNQGSALEDSNREVGLLMTRWPRCVLVWPWTNVPWRLWIHCAAMVTFTSHSQDGVWLSLSLCDAHTPMAQGFFKLSSLCLSTWAWKEKKKSKPKHNEEVQIITQHNKMISHQTTSTLVLSTDNHSICFLSSRISVPLSKATLSSCIPDATLFSLSLPS